MPPHPQFLGGAPKSPPCLVRPLSFWFSVASRITSLCALFVPLVFSFVPIREKSSFFEVLVRGASLFPPPVFCRRPGVVHAALSFYPPADFKQRRFFFPQRQVSSLLNVVFGLSESYHFFFILAWFFPMGCWFFWYEVLPPSFPLLFFCRPVL